MRTLTLLCVLGLGALASAQWSTDPADPLVLSINPNGAGGLQAISDGNDGWFAFWSDMRANGMHAEIYGQHLDADGYSLWTPNGLLIASVTDSSLSSVTPLLMPDGSVMVGYVYGGLSGYNSVVKVDRLDVDGSHLWSAPVELARAGPGPLGNLFGFGNLKGLVSGTTAFFAWSYTPQGGNDAFAYERVAVNGDVQFGPLGNPVPNSGWGPFVIHSDSDGGLVFLWRAGNGSGAPLLAQRMDALGAQAWATNVDVSLNTAGLSYDFATLQDVSTSNIIAVFVSDGDLRMTELGMGGDLLWSPIPAYACAESHAQDNPKIAALGTDFAVGWSDGRPPAADADMYVQKFDWGGTAQWATDGIPAIQTQTYVPTPNLVPSLLSVIATFDGTASGFRATRIHYDGTHLWAAPTAFCTADFNPFYGNRVVLPDGHDGVVAFWMHSAGGIGELYAARIYASGSLGDHTGLQESNSAAAGLNVQPSPTNGPLSVSLSDRSQLRSIRAIDAQGRAIAINGTRNSDRLMLDILSLADGIYTLEVVTDAGTRTGRFVIAR